MALDGITVSNVVAELSALLTDARISKSRSRKMTSCF